MSHRVSAGTIALFAVAVLASALPGCSTLTPASLDVLDRITAEPSALDLEEGETGSVVVRLFNLVHDEMPATRGTFGDSGSSRVQVSIANPNTATVMAEKLAGLGLQFSVGGLAAGTTLVTFTSGEKSVSVMVTVRPRPGVRLNVIPPLQAVTQGGQGTVGLDIIRTSFSGSVVLVVRDENGSVRAAGGIEEGSTSTVVDFPVSTSHTPGIQIWTVTASGAGIADATVPFQVNVRAPAWDLYSVRNGEQATRPWTKFLVQSGSDAFESRTIAPDGTVTFPLPPLPTPMQFVIQQTVGNDRHTFGYRIESDDTSGIRREILNVPVRGGVNATVTGVPDNSPGVAYAGPAVAPWPSTNRSPFALLLPRADVTKAVAAGCALFGPTGEPQKGVLSTYAFADGGSYACDLSGPGAKTYFNAVTTIVGGNPAVQYAASGGFALGTTLTQVYSRSFQAVTTNYWALNAADLPQGVLQWETVSHVAPDAIEAAQLFFSQPRRWNFTIPPPLGAPVVTRSVSSGAYVFELTLTPQVEYSGAWMVEYAQPNALGGVNAVTLLTLRSYYGQSLPSSVTLTTPTEPRLNATFFPRSPAGVTGSVAAYGYHPLAAPVSGELRLSAFKLNVSF